jgi:hypothetical protein
MTRFGWLLVLGIIVLAAILGTAVWLVRSHMPSVPAAPYTATAMPADPGALSIYTNGTYGFSLFYPSADKLSASFEASTTPAFAWRTAAAASGTPVVSLADASGELRIGASAAAKEVSACTKSSPAETTLPDLKLASTTFKGFFSDKLGTDAPVHIESYRAVHENACVAIELITPESSPQSDVLTTALHSFSFARP